MRHCLVLVLVAASCDVPEKKVPATDAGADAPIGDLPSDAPDTMITSAPGEFSRDAIARFEFTSTNPAATFECSVDGGEAAACTSPFTRSLGDGPHTFSVRAADAAGNSDDTPAEHVWEIDTAAPETTLVETPPLADNSVMVTFRFDSNERNAAFDCSLDGAAYAPCTSGSMFGVTDGTHSFAVRARDRAGNLDASPSIFAWSVDTSTPDTQLLSGPTGPQATTSAQFTFVSGDAGAGATFECAIDGAAFAPCVSPQSLSGLAEGPHTFSVRVRDAVGNYDPTPATRTWSVDLTPPDTQILMGPQGVTTSASASFTFASNEMDVTYTCSLDGAAPVACTSPESMTALAQGAHTFTVAAIDGAGHTDPTPATRAWTVDTVPPDIAVVSGPAAGATVGPRVVVGFTVTEGTVTCSIDGAAFEPCASPWAANLPAGAHTLRIRAIDAATNMATLVRSFTVACAAPDVAGAAGLLHLDDGTQSLANAVAGGAGATLGDTAMAEIADPAPTAGRFGGGLVFAAAEGDHVTWPMALGPGPAATIELWAKPDAAAGARALAASGDGVLALRAAASGADVVFSATVGNRSVSSAAVRAGQWHHVVLSVDPPVLRLWVDGVRSEVGGANDTFSLAELRLGGMTAAGYSGVLDEVWVSQSAITTDEPALVRYCPL